MGPVAGYLALGLPVAFAAFAVYVRLAPVDPLMWHVVLQTDTRVPEDDDCRDSVGPTARGGATGACMRDEPPETVLERLDGLAMATPRTTRIAGSAAEGRITWETRSRVFGFPDYTTAQATPVEGLTRLDLWARQRFGVDDMGVNSARLRDWLGKL